jgi:hypothetical protein
MLLKIISNYLPLFLKAFTALLDSLERRKGMQMPFLLGQIAQSVEQRTENPRVGSSILPLTTTFSIPRSRLNCEAVDYFICFR